MTKGEMSASDTSTKRIKKTDDWNVFNAVTFLVQISVIHRQCGRVTYSLSLSFRTCILSTVRLFAGNCLFSHVLLPAIIHQFLTEFPLTSCSLQRPCNPHQIPHSFQTGHGLQDVRSLPVGLGERFEQHAALHPLLISPVSPLNHVI